MTAARTIEPGDLVTLMWHDVYLAPKAFLSQTGKIEWEKISPNDIGFVVSVEEPELHKTFNVIVMFKQTSHLVRIRESMLKLENSET